jgi:hypothetical protein
MYWGRRKLQKSGTHGNNYRNPRPLVLEGACYVIGFLPRWVVQELCRFDLAMPSAYDVVTYDGHVPKLALAIQALPQ